MRPHTDLGVLVAVSELRLAPALGGFGVYRFAFENRNDVDVVFARHHLTDLEKGS